MKASWFLPTTPDFNLYPQIPGGGRKTTTPPFVYAPASDYYLAIAYLTLNYTKLCMFPMIIKGLLTWLIIEKIFSFLLKINKLFYNKEYSK